MLKDHDSAAILAVADMARARTFYEDVVGLEPTDEDDYVVTYRTGATHLVIYVSDYAGTNKANAVVWGVGDAIEGIVADLADKGVVFEHYDTMTLMGDIHVDGPMKLAWFADPDGNLLHINNM